MPEPTYQQRLEAERERRLHAALQAMIVEQCGDSVIQVTGRLIFRFDDGSMADICVMAKKGENNFGTK